MAWRLHVVGLATSKGNDANGCGFGRERWIPARAAAFLPFRWRAGRRTWCKEPCYPLLLRSLCTKFHPLFVGARLKTWCKGTPLTLITPFPLHQIPSSFRRPAAQDLVQKTPLTLILPFLLHQVSSSFRRPAVPALVQGAPLTLIIPFPLHQVPPTFPYCGPSARGFQPPRGGAAHICICAQIICSILCT